MADIRSDDAHGVLVGRISRLSSLVDRVVVDLTALHVLVVDSLSTVVSSRVILIVLIKSLGHS